MEAIKKARSLNIPRSHLKASKGWAIRFMRRMGLALRPRTTICQMLPKDFEQKLLNYQRYITNLRKTATFLMGQGQCWWNGHLSWYAAKLHIGEERREGGTLGNHWVRKASPNSNAGSNCWWEETTTLANFEKEDFTHIRGVSKGRYSQGPGKRMDDRGADVGVAENSMGSQD